MSHHQQQDKPPRASGRGAWECSDYHFGGTALKANPGKTEKSELKYILQNNWPILIKNVKVKETR